MAGNKPPEDENWRVHELEFDSSALEGDDAWAQALADLEKELPQVSPTPPSKPPNQPKIRPQSKAPARSQDAPEADLQETLAKTRQARQALQAFLKDHPYLVAPNISSMADDSLRETIFTMERELQKLGGGQPS